MLLAGHNHRVQRTSASDLVTRAGGALVIQAGTATSTRVREQDQSFNVIDIADSASPDRRTLGRRAFAPADAQRSVDEGRWRMRKPTAEPRLNLRTAALA